MLARLGPSAVRLNDLTSLAPVVLRADSLLILSAGGADRFSSQNNSRHFSTALRMGPIDLTLKKRTPIAGRIDSFGGFSPRRTFVQVSPTEFYDVMGLTPKATADQIKTTYFKLSKIYHPDVCKDPGGVEKFVLISKAYEVLGNEEKRREYDRGIMNPLDDRSAATRAQREFTHDDILRYQEIFNQHHDIPKAKRSQFVQRGKKKGIYDFDAYYKEHYQAEMSHKASSAQENDNMSRNAEEVFRTRKLEEYAEDDAKKITGFKSFIPWIVILATIYFLRKWGVLSGPFR